MKVLRAIVDAEARLVESFEEHPAPEGHLMLVEVLAISNVDLDLLSPLPVAP